MADYSYDDSELRKVAAEFDRLQMFQIYNIAITEYKNNFNEGGFTDTSFVRWPASKKNDGGATLVKSGNLRRSIRTVNITSNSFSIISDLPYSDIMNEGGVLTATQKNVAFFKAQMIKNKKNPTEFSKWSKIYGTMIHNGKLVIPKRKFLGPSQDIVNKMIQYIDRYIK
jgi:phage gpG-like protein